MYIKLKKAWLGALVTGGFLLQGCPLNSDDVQEAAATSVDGFLATLFTTALTQWVNVAFGVN